jgi:hypothetical protein
VVARGGIPPPDRQDHAGVDLVVAQPLAQPLHVDGDGVGTGRAAPDRIADLLAGHHPVRVDHQQLQQAQLAHGHADQPTVQADLERGGVETEPTGLQRGLRLDEAVRPDGAQDRQQLPEPVRVGHARGGAGRERLDRRRAVGVADADDDRDGGTGGQRAGQRGPTDGGQGRGRQDGVGMLRARGEQRLRPVGADDRRDLMFSENLGELVRLVDVAVGDEKEERVRPQARRHVTTRSAP